MLLPYQCMNNTYFDHQLSTFSKLLPDILNNILSYWIFNFIIGNNISHPPVDSREGIFRTCIRTHKHIFHIQELCNIHIFQIYWSFYFFPDKHITLQLTPFKFHRCIFYKNLNFPHIIYNQLTCIPHKTLQHSLLASRGRGIHLQLIQLWGQCI